MYDKPNAPSQLLLFADPPNLNELCVVTAKLSKQIVQQSSAVQPQILKCREIIFTEPTIIATPALDVSNAFYVVMEQSLYKTGRLQARFQKIGLEASKPMMVGPAMYQACLRYTLVARIAPNWNKTGEWLIQGRDFLTSNGYVNAVKLDITVNQEEMYFSLDATTVKFLPLHVEDLDIFGRCYKEFMQYHHAEIDESAIGSPWSHVLPSMKKGKVVGVTRTLPQNGPFKSYKDLKRHWKNTYGYRLPETEDGVIYYQVHFRPLGGRIFTYPEVCLRASDIQRVPRVDPKPILTAFLQGVQSKMPSICGIPLRLQTKAKYPILELIPPNLQMSKQANLSNRSSSGKIIYRSREEMEIMLNRTHGASQSSQSTVHLTDNIHPQDSHSQNRTHGASQSSQSTVHLTDDIHPRDSHSQNRTHGASQRSQSTVHLTDDIHPRDSHSQNRTHGASQRSQSNLTDNIHPQDSHSQNRTHGASQSSQSTFHLTDDIHPQNSHSQVPVHQEDNDGIFLNRNQSAHSEVSMSRVPQSGGNHQREITSSTRDPASNVCHDVSQPTLGSEQTTQIPGGDSSTKPTPTQGSRIIPSFSAKKSNIQKSNSIFGSSATSAPKAVPVFKLKKVETVASTVLPSSSLSNGTGPNGKDLQTRPPIKVTCLSEKKPLPGQINGSVLSETATVPSLAPSFTPKSVDPIKSCFITGKTPQQFAVKHTLSVSSSVRVSCTGTGSGSAMRTPSTPQTPSFHILSTPKVHQVTPKGTPTVSRKRPNQDEGGTPKLKKPRAKPQIQENLDVELFARANQLQKANAATLIAWLKDKGIQHKTKDKKLDLIDRVNTVLGLGVEP